MRAIVRLDIKNDNVVKGINFDGLRVVGKPIDLAKKYYENGADEIFYIDCVASLYGQNNLTNIILQSAKNIFIPFCAGGGIRNIDDATKFLRSGADKVILNTAAIENPLVVNTLVKNLGSQSVVLSVEAKKISPGKWEAYKNFGRDRSGLDAIEWVKESKNLGVGEILLTSIENEGRGNGFDIELYEECNGLVDVPIIASGGFQKLEHIEKLISKTDVDGFTISQALHYNKITMNEIKKYLANNC